MAGYFYTQNKQKHGPVSSSELKQLAASGRLQPTDTVMKEGSNKWVAAGSVKGLFGERQAASAPAPAPVPQPMPQEPAASGGSRWLLWLVLLLVVGGLAAGGFMFMGKGDGDSPSDKDGGKQTKKDGGGNTKDGGNTEVIDEDAGSPENAKRKMDAWKAFLDAFTMNVSDSEREAHLEKCEKLLDNYLKIPFDPLKFKDEAREITKAYLRRNIPAQHPAWEPRKKLDSDIQAMKTALLTETK